MLYSKIDNFFEYVKMGDDLYLKYILQEDKIVLMKKCRGVVLFLIGKGGEIQGKRKSRIAGEFG